MVIWIDSLSCSALLVSWLFISNPSDSLVFCLFSASPFSSSCNLATTLYIIIIITYKSREILVFAFIHILFTSTQFFLLFFSSTRGQVDRRQQQQQHSHHHWHWHSITTSFYSQCSWTLILLHFMKALLPLYFLDTCIKLDILEYL